MYFLKIPKYQFFKKNKNMYFFKKIQKKSRELFLQNGNKKCLKAKPLNII